MWIFKRFFPFIAPFWKVGAWAFLLSVAGAGLGLLTPYLTKLIVDKAYGSRDFKLFVILVVITGIVFVLGSLFQGLSNYFVRYLKLRVALQLNRGIFQKFQSLPYGFFQNSSTGESLYKINYDIDQVTQWIADIVLRIIVLIPQSIFILTLILWISPKMFIFVLVLAPFLYIGPYHFSKVLRQAWKIWVEGSQGIFQRLQETFSHMYLIKVCGRERREARSYLKGVIENTRTRLKNIKLEVGAFFFNSVVQKAILGAIIFYGGCEVVQGRMTLGSLSAISIYLAQLSGIQGIVANFIQQISSGLVSCERLDRILGMPKDPFEEKAVRAVKFQNGKIEFEGVTFAYGPERKVLEEISFSVEGGACIALMGPSGCGKTTIINLILRLYRPASGRIHIDGEDIQTVSARTFYEQIGVVLQASYLWNDTLENNIRYGKEDASLAEIEEAAGIACIEAFIHTLPGKYKTVIGESACKVSEGQKQRIAIARAVLKKPKILLLDEAFSSLDSELEEKILGHIRKALPGSTIVLISHRPSTLQRTDRVYFLEEGRKMDSGTHDEILRRNAKYGDHFTCQ